MERVCRPGGCVVIVWPNNIRWLAAHGYRYVSFGHGEMFVEFASHGEAAELTEIFYPGAIGEVRRRRLRRVPCDLLGDQSAARPRVQDDRAMKVAIVAPLVSAIREPQRGGSQSFVSDLARGLIDRGHEVHLFAASGSEVAGVQVIDTGVDHRPLEATLYRASGPVARVLAVADTAFAGVYAAVREARYDVVHNHAFDVPAVRLATATARAGGAHASPTPRRGGCRRTSSCRSGRPSPDHRGRVRVPSERLATGRRSRRGTAAVRPHTLDPLVSDSRGSRGLRRQAEFREGSRRSDRDHAGRRRRHRCLRRHLRRRIHPGTNRPTTRRARRRCSSRRSTNDSLGRDGSRCRRPVPSQVGGAVRDGCR